MGATVVVKRTYLADAEFIVRITCEGHAEDIDRAVSSPTFATYLGRKAFPATFPFYLGVGNADLLNQIPVLSDEVPDTGKMVVNHYWLAKDEGTQPTTSIAPCVSSRQAWLSAVKNLGLKRRATIRK